MYNIEKLKRDMNVQENVYCAYVWKAAPTKWEWRQTNYHDTFVSQ